MGRKPPVIGPMLIYIGADHRGFKLKELLKRYLIEKRYRVLDLGNRVYDSRDDYPDFASRVAKKVSQNPKNSQGILICGSGVGMDVAANRFKNVRSALVGNAAQAMASRNDDDANVLTLASDFITLAAAKRIVLTWLATPFGNLPRYKRRLKKIAQM